MKTRKKIIIAGALILALAAGAAGTLAYMTSKTQIVTNTFTVGNIKITLDETDNTKTDGSRTESGNTYSRMLPGDTLDKDPVVHVEKGSEECYLFVHVNNGIDAALKTYTDTLANGTDASTWAARYNITGSWTAVDGYEGLYQYDGTVDASAAEDDIDIPVFTEVIINTGLNNEETAALQDSTITLQAFAHQTKNADAAEALAQAAAALGFTE